MSYDDLVQRAWRNHTLLSVLLELTYSCNLDCILCYNDRKHRGRPLRLDQYRQLIDDLAKMAVLHLTLSGGEPLVHRNFWAIGSHARDRGFVMRIKSNGHAIRPRMARRLKQEIDPFVIEVSLHGACAATHDRQTRVDGSFSQLMRNIQAMLQVGIRVQLNVPLTRWNEAEINEMCALADQLGLLLQIDSDVTPRDDGHRGPFSIAVTKTGLRRLYEMNRARFANASSIQKQATNRSESANPRIQKEKCREYTSKHCGAGSSGLAIDPYGNVYPCVQWRIPLGSLHSKSVKDIWEDSEELKRMRALSVRVGEARKSVKAGARLAFCPGVAQMETGSPFDLYSGYWLRMAAVDECQKGN